MVTWIYKSNVKIKACHEYVYMIKTSCACMKLNKIWTCHGYKNKSCLNVQYNIKEKNGYISLNIVIS